jgi:integrase/recombinase XerD
MRSVHVYTRHRASCSHKKDRAWKTCSCPKWLLWHHRGQMFRQSASTAKWDVAAQKARRIEDDFERAALGKPAVSTEGVTLAATVRLFLIDREAQHLKPSTISKLTTIFEKQMLTWFTDLGVRHLRDITLPHLQGWRATWEDGPLASKKKQERVRGFFWFCIRNKWITDNPALGLSSIKADVRPAVPFTKDEFLKIVQSCEQFGKTEEQRVRLRAMVLLLRWSGLAIRDAVTLERSALTDDDRLILRRAKTGVNVMLPLQPQVALMLRHMVKNPNARYFFWSGNGLPKSAVADWQRALRRLFKIADLKHPDGKMKRCHPHMFRHTFSVELLLAGVPIEDVARLLGHSSIKTTEKYYSSWVKARADRLEESVKAAW